VSELPGIYLENNDYHGRYVPAHVRLLRPKCPQAFFKVPILELRNIDDKELKFLADFIYEKIFVNYTAKQWGKKPEDISAEVTGRVPVHKL
jgi:UDP-galactopyranose mutase